MANSGIRTRYHIAINSHGFMLRGAPQSPAYLKQDVPNQAVSVLSSDQGYDQFAGNGWKYWAQTDWSGGMGQIKWKDDATFLDGQGIDVLGEFGKVSLQNNFTSAISISGSHSYGAHAVHDNQLLFGTVKSGAAKIFRISASNNAIAALSAYAGISAVNSMSRFANDTLIGLTRTSGTLKTLAVYRNGAISAIRNTNPIVRAVKGIGIRAYVAEKVAATSGDMVSYSTSLPTFSSAFFAGKNRKVQKIEDLNGTPYFFVEDGKRVEMFKYDEFADKTFPIYTWSDLTSWGVTKYVSVLAITGIENGSKVAYAFNGARVWQVSVEFFDDSSYDFSKPFVFEGNFHTKGAQWDGVAWVPGLYGKFATVQYTPFVDFNSKAYGFAVSGTNMRLAYVDTAKYQVSGNVVGSNFGHQIGAVDKLVNMATVNCEGLATGQMIELLRSTNEGSSYTSIGTLKFATEGALTAKDLYFPSGFVTKTWLYKAVLVGSGTTTPSMTDVSFQYRPTPNTKRRWSLAVDAGDNIKLLNGQQEQRRGKDLMESLWLEKEAKRSVTFEDVSSFSAKIVSAMTSAATSARVNQTGGFPLKGRMRVVSGGVAEEMTFTTANGGKILGVSRAQKGTKARAYISGTRIDNYHTVILTDLQEQINNTDDNKTESIARLTLLEV